MADPTLIFVVGPQAVGKMTVGQELSRMNGYKFMHNHQTIDVLLPLFDFESPAFKRLLFDFRVSICEEFAASDLPGLIYSCVPDYDSILDRAQNECYAAPFLRRGGRVLFVELQASLQTRIDRNRGEHRLHDKPTKRDLDFSEQLLHKGESMHSNSDGDFPYGYPYLKIVNEALSPQEVASQICSYFGLPAVEPNANQSS
jgi:hypothetical protein